MNKFRGGPLPDWFITPPVGLRWNVLPVGYLFRKYREIPGPDKADTYQRLSLTMNDVLPRSRQATDGIQRDSFDSYQLLKPNQIVFKLIDLENISTSRVGLSRDEGLVSPAYLIVEPSDKVVPRYAYWYFMDLYLRQIYNNLAENGVRAALGWESLKELPFPLLSLNQQTRIADFLDTETTKIDHLIAKQRELISLLEERLSAFMENALVKGISHDKASPMEWRRVKHLFKLRDERNQLEREEVTLLSLYAKHGVRKYDEIEERTGNPVRTVQDYKCVHAGDIIVNIILAWMGSIGRSPHNGVISPAYDIWTPLEGVSSRYYHYLFRTKWFSGECYKRGKGIMMMRWRTYADQFGDIRVPFPTQQEQDYLVNLIEHEESQVQNLISKCQRMIDLLQERRSALITAAVTGQIEV